MIDRNAAIALFAQTADHGVDTERELLWGYFFVDRDPETLRSAVPDLLQDGYRLVALFEADAAPDDGPAPTWVLHVERVERHDVDSLDARNQQLNRFATACGIETYDGMDVGPVDGKPFPQRP